MLFAVEIVCGLLFLASSGLLFNSKFRDNKILVAIAGAIAILATYFLTMNIVERIVDERFENFSSNGSDVDKSDIVGEEDSTASQENDDRAGEAAGDSLEEFTEEAPIDAPENDALPQEGLADEAAADSNLNEWRENQRKERVESERKFVERANLAKRSLAKYRNDVQGCNSGAYFVFYSRHSSEITPEAEHTLNKAIEHFKSSCQGSLIHLTGHTDRSDTEDESMVLSRDRGLSVHRYLRSNGISSSNITWEWFGESLPRVLTEDGVRELQNNRVEMIFYTRSD